MSTLADKVATALEDRYDPVVEGADRAASVLECPDLADELNPKLVASLGSASPVGGGA